MILNRAPKRFAEKVGEIASRNEEAQMAARSFR